MSKARRILVTGAGGFVGSWLVPELVASGAEVIGTQKPGLPQVPGIECLEVDLREASACADLVRRVVPQQVVHLAALAIPAEAARDPKESQRINFNAVEHLLSAVSRFAADARVLLVSSGEVYGRSSLAAPPAQEDDPLRPENPYATAKAAAERSAVLRGKENKLDIVRARPFNHTGPRRPIDYAESSFAAQIVAIERGQQTPVIQVGNLESVRDFTDVRDVAQAYLKLLEDGARGAVYNVCSGQGRSIREVLDQLLAHAKVEVNIEIDHTRFRPTHKDAIASVGRADRLLSLGWKPRYDLSDTLRDLLDDWRARPRPR